MPPETYGPSTTVTPVANLVNILIRNFQAAEDLYIKLDDVRRRRDLDDRRHHHGWQADDRGLASGPGEEYLKSCRAAIRHEYERGHEKVGQAYPIGDPIAQNQLQAQIIGLQQVLLSIHENTMYGDDTANSRTLSEICSSSKEIRHGSISALVELCQRMLQSFQSHPEPSTPAANNTARAGEPDERDSTETDLDDLPLFCRYALELQHNPHEPLQRKFDEVGTHRCPCCSLVIPLDHSHAWEITHAVRQSSAHGSQAPSPIRRRHSDVKDDREPFDRAELRRSLRRFKFDSNTSSHHPHSANSGDSISPGRTPSPPAQRVFRVKNRFVMKCHRDVGHEEFACVMCSREKDADTICGSIKILIRHVWLKHEVDEYMREPDIYEIR